MLSIMSSMRSRAAAIVRNPKRAALGVAALLVPAICTVAFAVALAPAFTGSERIPVAVVNLDRGATDAKGRVVSAGEDLVDSLQQTGDLAWNVVDEKEADAGLADGTYALILKVPTDYSKAVASLSGDEPRKATVEIVSDGSGNVLATRAGSAALRQVQSRLKSTLGEDYLVSVLNDVRGQASRLSLTADGSVMLDAGYDVLKQGADAVSTGLGQTAAAAGQLTSGLGQIASGVSAAGTGADALSRGITTVQQQAAEPLAQGAGALASGLDKVASTAQTMGQGVAGIGTALGTLRDTLASANDDLAGLMGMGSELAKEGETLRGASASMQQALADAKQPLESLASIGSAAAPALKQTVDNTGALSSAISSDAQDSLHTRIQGLRSTLAGLEAARDGVRAAFEGAASGGAEVPADSTAADGADGSGASRAGASALAALDEQIASLRAQIEVLEQTVDPAVDGSLAQRAEVASSSASAASQQIAGAVGDAAALAPLSASIASSGVVATDALANMGTTLEGQQQNIKNIAAALAGGQAILAGTNPVTGETHDLAATATALGQGVSALGDQLSGDGALGKGVAGIATGTKTLAAALTPFATGAGQLAQGNAALGTALGAVSQGASGLGQGLSVMASATGQLSSGVDQLKEASGKMADTMGKAGDALSAVSGDHADRAKVAANPVTFSTLQRHAVDDAASLTPVFIAAAIWLGALLSSLVLPAVDMRAVLIGHGATSILTCLGGYALLGLLQAVLVVGVLLVLGIQVGDALAFTVLLAVGVVVCAALAQLMRLFFGRLAGAVSLGLLALQLMCSGAVLPAAFTGGVFAALGSVLPLPVLAQALRGAIAGAAADWLPAVIMLAIWFVLALVLTLLVAASRRTVCPERISR